MPYWAVTVTMSYFTYVTLDYYCYYNFTYLLLLLISSLLHICQIGLLLHLCLRDEKGASAVVRAHLCSVVDHFVSWYSGDGDGSLVMIVLLMQNLVVIFNKNTDWRV